MNFRDKLAARVQENQIQAIPAVKSEVEQEVFDIPNRSPFYGVENVRNHPSCLDLRLSNGCFLALPYAYFIELSYSPSDGIHILSTTKRISIIGRNLQELYRYLVSYRINYVQANIGNDLSDSNSLFVRGIEVEDLEIHK